VVERLNRGVNAALVQDDSRRHGAVIRERHISAT